MGSVIKLCYGIKLDEIIIIIIIIIIINNFDNTLLNSSQIEN